MDRAEFERYREWSKSQKCVNCGKEKDGKEMWITEIQCGLVGRCTAQLRSKDWGLRQNILGHHRRGYGKSRGIFVYRCAFNHVLR